MKNVHFQVVKIFCRCKSTKDGSPVFLGQVPRAVGGKESCVQTQKCLFFSMLLQAVSSLQAPILHGPSRTTDSRDSATKNT